MDIIRHKLQHLGLRKPYLSDALCTINVLPLSLLNYIVLNPTYNKKTFIFKVNTWPEKPAVFILA